MPGLIGLDFETYGGVNLPKHGLHRYVNDKTFMPLIGGVYDPEDQARYRFDLARHRKQSTRDLRDLIGSRTIVAHNAPFEQEVLFHLGLDYPCSRFIDSAVVARVAGAGPRLEAAAPQLLAVDKMAEGAHLIKVFSVPGEYQEENGNLMFDERVIEAHPDKWDQFGEYCELDAELGYRIVGGYLGRLTLVERKFAEITMRMNRIGWPVDVSLVEEMNIRYLENLGRAELDFHTAHDPAFELNIYSHAQLKEWCEARGVRAKSFDKEMVESMLRRVQKKVLTMGTEDPKLPGYMQVIDLLQTKQILGGTSLKKLQVILNHSIEDTWNPGGHRLRDQYVHAGAGQTLRTTGRSVQMQNLKRLGPEPDPVEELLEDPDSDWDNDQLAANLRQCFIASTKGGRLIVGDFSSVESRGLAYLAEAEWKLEAFRQGLDMYKVGASKQFGIDYDMVSKEQRQFGKVGELSCGYQAGGGAVQSFAGGMGVTLTEGEASKVVSDWRAANPEIVLFWDRLHEMLASVVEEPKRVERLFLKDGLRLELQSIPAPVSLHHQMKGVRSLQVTLLHGGEVMMKRYFHGVYARGRDICYHKPSERKTGDLWRNGYVNPKTKQFQLFTIYGGKLAGILTQSLCREIFMRCMVDVHEWTQEHVGQVALIGQFHDEMVVDWKPGALSLEDAKRELEGYMSNPGVLVSFPLAADIKDDYRYTK